MKKYPSEVTVNEGDISITVPRGTSHESINRQIAYIRESRKRALSKITYISTHKVWNKLTDTCYDCGRTRVEIHANRSKCIVDANAETGKK
jgi:hypothetical protein